MPHPWTQPTAACTAWRPRIFDITRRDHREELDALHAGGAIRFVFDTIADQLAELVRAREPSRTLTAAAIAARIARHLDGRARPDHGRWVFYPWSGRLVHVLPPDELRALRSDRNHYKITPAEQELLRARRIGVVGLSVGQAVALTLALEGVGGAFRLADFDPLSVSNTNRLRAGVHELGVNKAALAARQMLELDPYLDIEVFTDGVTDANLDDFLGAPGARLDLLVEECDDLAMKVALREAARARRIPVIMETSERGMLDIERFDREPARPVLHGLLDDVGAAELRGLSMRDKIPFALRVLGAASCSTRMVASMVEINETISTWPQLGSAVTLGGAVVTDAARRILLGQLEASGRYHVDVEALVRDGAAVALPPVEPAASTPPAERREATLPQPARPASGAPTTDELRWIVAHAQLAPSGGNVQPWLFEADGARLRVRLDAARAGGLLDYQHRASHLALGAAIENAVLAAGGLGLGAAVTTLPEPGVAAELRLTRGAVEVDPLLAQVIRRATHRGHGDARPLTAAQFAAHAAAAAAPGVRLALHHRPEAIAAIGALIGAGDRWLMLSQQPHRELMRELRWSGAEAAATGDGIRVDEVGRSPADVAALRLIARWSAMAEVRGLGGGRALENPARDAFASSSAVGLLSIAGTGPEAYLAGGRALERVWLTATAVGLGLQPHSALLYCLMRLDDGGKGLDPGDRAGLDALRAQRRRVLPPVLGESELLLFRLFHAAPAAARSLRRPLDAVFTLAA